MLERNFDKLFTSVSLARKNTIHYSKNLLHLPKIDSMKLFCNIPLLDKEDIRKDYKLFLAKGRIEKDLDITYTSGSTGVPIKYIRSRRETIDLGMSLAMERKKWINANLPYTIAHFFKTVRPITYKYSKRQKSSMILSLYDHTPERLNLFISALSEFKPTILQGYSSTLYEIAKYIKDNNVKLPEIKLIENRSEHLSEKQRNFIENTFDTKVSNMYGMAEHYPIAYSCRLGNMHICEGNAFVEIISSNTNNPVGDGETGEIVITSLISETMPLIRYKTGDIGKISTNNCECGDTRAILELSYGRTNNYIKTPHGNINSSVIRRLFRYMYDDELNWINQSQIIQEDYYTFKVNLVPNKWPLNNVNVIERKVEEIVKSSLPYNVKIKIEWVSKLEKNPVSKKVSEFISKC
ncbi:hypothetical protein CR203_23350 [Salipaludibacillus neizhouensis]|uniref:AMP-dependent synthetase/ligase domain-containing protein n=1 Tax=Salipaludibacillus neizhouensis TaxID=885475 RepID=A0A3A9JWV2_9BACI|nr:AMP-binding protein [Salipaludibacillus neizhouensis]RKL64947.1 hypothetical protein CR203_23350 [Salipaludibacillus neizhouensis]